MVLRHVYFIVKTYVYCWLLCLQGVILIKSLVKHDALSTYKNNDKTGVFWHAKFIVKTECFHTEARQVAYIIVKTDAWRMWASPLRSGMQVLVRNLTKTLCFWRSCSRNIGFYTCLRCLVAGIATRRVEPRPGHPTQVEPGPGHPNQVKPRGAPKPGRTCAPRHLKGKVQPVRVGQK